jgi:hypothetical protein
MFTSTMLRAVVLGVFTSTTHAFCGHRTSLDPHVVDSYESISETASDWGYDGLSNGPINWFSDIRWWNKGCSFLSTQSPSNFPHFVRAAVSPYVMNSKPQNPLFLSRSGAEYSDFHQSIVLNN